MVGGEAGARAGWRRWAAALLERASASVRRTCGLRLSGPAPAWLVPRGAPRRVLAHGLPRPLRTTTTPVPRPAEHTVTPGGTVATTDHGGGPRGSVSWSATRPIGSATWPWSATAGRQDHPGRGAAAPSRRHHPAGPGRGRHHRLRLRRPRSSKRGLSLSLAVAPFEWKGHKINLLDTRATPTSWATCRRPAGRRPGRVRGQRRRGRRGADRGGVAHGRRAAASPGMVFVNKLDRERAELRAHARPAARPVRRRAWPRSSCPSATRPASGASPTCSPTPPTSTTTASPHTERDPRRAWSRAEHAVHDNLVEGIVVGRRRAAGALPRRRRPVARGARAHARRRRGRRHRVPGRVRLGDRARSASTGWPTSSWRSGRRRSTGRDDRRRRATPTVDVAPDPERPAAGLRVQDHRRPLRRPGLPVPGAVGHDPRRRPPGQHPHRHRRAPARPVHRAGQGAAARRRGRRRRHRRRGQAGGHDDRRHPGAPGHAGGRVPPIEQPEPVLAVAIAAATQADEDKLAPALPPPPRGGPGAAGRARRRDPPDAAARHRRDPPAGRPREADPQVRRATSTPRTCGSPTARRSPARPEAEGKHKKQTGGHGQFGVAVVDVEPLPRGDGFEFVDKIVGGAIPRGFIPAVEKGIEEAMAVGRRLRLPGGRRPGHAASTASTTRSTPRR